MLNLELFLGVEISDELKQKYNALNPHLKKTFIDNASSYLHEASLDSRLFLGKNLGKVAETDSLSLLKENTLSLLRKLFGEHQSFALKVLALPK